jgi:hypothetical protein
MRDEQIRKGVLIAKQADHSPLGDDQRRRHGHGGCCLQASCMTRERLLTERVGRPSIATIASLPRRDKTESLTAPS